MATFLRELVKNAVAEIQAAETLPQRLRRLGFVLSVLLSEIPTLLTLAPYAAATLHLYRSLPTIERVQQAGQEAARHGVAIQRDMQYGPGPRAVLDLYTPAWACQAQQHHSNAAGQQQQQGQPRDALPVVFFVHGGIWATGEKWHYAPLATRLAQEGHLVLVPTYDYFPKVLAPAMVKEVSDALSWCQDNVAAYGGDPKRIAVAAHSAGAHLAALVLLSRAAAVAAAGSAPAVSSAQGAVGNAPSGTHTHISDVAPVHALVPQPAPVPGGAAGRSASPSELQQADQTTGKQGGVAEASAALAAPGAAGGLPAASEVALMAATSTRAGDAGPLGTWREALGITDTRIPAMFVGLAGVYDISKLYELETLRGVHNISVVARAMGGPSRFAALSPSVIVGHHHHHHHHHHHRHHHGAISGHQTLNSSDLDPDHRISGTVAAQRDSGLYSLSEAPATSGAGSGDGSNSGDCSEHSCNSSHSGSSGSIDANTACKQVGPPAPISALHPARSLIGDSIPLRAGLSSACTACTADHELSGTSDPNIRSAATPLGFSQSACTCAGDLGSSLHSGSSSGTSTAPMVVRFWQALPPMYIMSSCADIMVPWHEGAAFTAALHQCGVPARHLIYNHVRHHDYIMSWRLRRDGGSPRDERPGVTRKEEAPADTEFQQDLLVVLRGMQPRTQQGHAGAKAGVLGTAGRNNAGQGGDSATQTFDPAQGAAAARLQGVAHVSRL